MRVAFLSAVISASALASGCLVVQTGVTNPIPAMRTVAVAPFVNLSAERSVDGRQFALAYHAELQKIPGYQVIPVGVTEQAIVDLGLNLSGPGDAIKLAKALGADAVVIGAVTDYNPYYPPRIGLQVSWYAPEPGRFLPGIPTDPRLNDAVRAWRFAHQGDLLTPASVASPSLTVIRAQSPSECAESGDLVLTAASKSAGGPHLMPPVPPPLSPQTRIAAKDALPQKDTFASGQQAVEEAPTAPIIEASGALQVEPSPVFCPPNTSVGETFVSEYATLPPAGPHDPNQPIMSYTRIFDGSDAELTALLRDYVILSGDLRSGGWEAYLHRTEDFMRFTAHRMIVEMLTLHGGESKRRYVWFLGNHKRS